METSSRLRELLELESYPQIYTHKFIGHNTGTFLAAVEAFECSFPKVRRIGQRESGGGTGSGRYLAMTYELYAESAAEILTMIAATGELADLKMIF